MRYLIFAVVCLFTAGVAFGQNPFIAIRGNGFNVNVDRGRGVLVQAPGVVVDAGRGRGLFVQAPGFDFNFNRFAAVPVYQGQLLPAQVPQRFAGVQVIAPGVAVNVNQRRFIRPLRRRCR